MRSLYLVGASASVLNILLEVLILKLQYLGHLMQRTDSLEKTLMLVF